MKVGFFIPCHINQLYPKGGIATLELFEKLVVDVLYPMGQTCCGGCSICHN
ncbi:heterodisulfide reductase-related iron-sulfur binding cluster [Yeosuana aromativorans]|uniref:heterodisulfide reductase-related iron-sulfur binding cluster n=1 Tax=Yeosuana aromativorans TaxID=288019 RepID=UPI0016693138